MFQTAEKDKIKSLSWAFEKGYKLGMADFKDGVYINFEETKKHFLSGLKNSHSNQSEISNTNPIYFQSKADTTKKYE